MILNAAHFLGTGGHRKNAQKKELLCDAPRADVKTNT